MTENTEQKEYITLKDGSTMEYSLSNPVFADFERLPTTFNDFISNPYYLGNSWGNPWPFWKQKGNEFFPLPMKSPYTALILLGATGIGKALPNYQGVLTPSGYKPIGEIEVGDLIASNDGKFYPVLGVYPQGKQPVYEITFSKKRKTRCSDQHIWTISRDGGKTFKEETVSDILFNGYYKQNIQLPTVQQIQGIPTKVQRDIAAQSNKGLTIKKIKFIGMQECTCISVGAPNKLFLTERAIPTHNTSFAVNMVAAYFLHIILCLRNPHEFFALEEQKNIVFAFLNIVTKTIAYKNAWGMFHKALLKSPFFMEYGVKSEGRNPEWICKRKPVELLYGSTADQVIGLDLIFVFLDEVSFARNQDIQRQMEKAKEVFDAALERIQSRFTKFGGIFDGLIVMASSKRTDQAFAEVYAEELSSGKNGHRTMIIDEARWDVLPQGTYSGETFPVALGDSTRPSEIIEFADIPIYEKEGYKIIYPPIESYDEFKRDMMHALTNIAGESVSASGTFLQGSYITAVTDTTRQNPFVVEEIKVGEKDDLNYWDFFDLSRVAPEDFTKPLYIHLDASLGKDGNSISGGNISFAQQTMNLATGQYQPELHYKQVFKIKVRAPKGDRVMLRKNTQFIFWLKSQGFNIALVTSDQYQCLAKGTLIWTPKGYKAIETLVEGDEVLSYNIAKGVFELTKVKNIWQSRKEKKFTQVNTMKAGIKVTDDHLFLTPSGYKRADQLSKYDMIIGGVRNESNSLGVSEMTISRRIWEYGLLEMFSKRGGSEAEKQLYNIITGWGVTARLNDRKAIRPYELDIYIPDKRIAIEYDGIYRHSFEEVKKRDELKDQLCKEKGIRLIRIKEQDYLDNPDYCIGRIFEALELDGQLVIDTKPVETEEETLFYDIETESDNHNYLTISGIVHNSVQFGQDLTAGGINYRYQSIDKVTQGVNQPFSVLKNAIYDKRISLLEDEDQFTELISLVQYEGGRVDKNMKGISDDTAQTLAGWVYAASLNKENYIRTNAVLAATFIGSTTAEKRAVEDQIVSPKLISELIQNEFGAYKVTGYTGLRDAYEQAFSLNRNKKDKAVESERNPFYFF
jgi:very-short-patch-repair endonuclease